MTRRHRRAFVAASFALLTLAPLTAPAVEFERVVIDDDFPGAYQVEVADVNGDKKPDVVAVGGGTCAWYENPTWKKRVVTGPKQSPGVISSATADIDGDGKAEIAVAYEFSMNEPTKGKLLLARQGKGVDDPWTVEPVDDLGSIHRLRWMVYEIHLGANSVRFSKAGEGGRKITQLVAAPIFGPSARPPLFQEEPAHVALYSVGDKPEPRPALIGSAVRKDSLSTDTVRKPTLVRGVFAEGAKSPKPRTIADAPVLHAIDVVNFLSDDIPEVLGASNLGITRTFVFAVGGALLYRTDVLVPGAPGDAPKKGASEIHVGRLKDGRRFLATVEPWHGTDVVVYLTESLKPLKFGPRTVIDSTLKDGHALWVADVDGDGDDEVFAGYRGPGTSVLAFDFDGKSWVRSVVDDKIAAQDLRGGDIDGDGTPDVVAVGGSTHNVVWYRPKAAKK